MEHRPNTIAAIATPYGRGGIGIVKISGPKAISIIQKTFLPGKMGAGSADVPAAPFTTSHRLHYGRIVHPHTREEIDEVLVSIMKGPNSYTGEDVAEINAHGGAQVLQEILELVLENGAEAAQPGEFTLRAFLNGKIDLTQAEAISELIYAKSRLAAKLAAKQLGGGIQKKIAAIQDALVGLRSEIEARIEFMENDTADGNEAGWPDTLRQKIIHPIQEMLARYDQYQIVREGMKIVLVGKPNVGKSSLLNAICERSRAIVTAMPGTTRDIIEEEIFIQGIPATLMDTAGIQETKDEVESIGIERAMQMVETAQLILWVIDVSEPIDDRDVQIWRHLKDKKFLLVGNKNDLGLHPHNEKGIEDAFNARPILISAKNGTGLTALRRQIADTIKMIDTDVSGIDGVPNARHKAILERSLALALDIEEKIKADMPLDLVSYDLRTVKETLGGITGESPSGDVYDLIFSKFCVGK